MDAFFGIVGGGLVGGYFIVQCSMVKPCCVEFVRVDTDTGAEVADDIRRFTAEIASHHIDAAHNDAGEEARGAAVNQSESEFDWIEDKERAAISRADCEQATLPVAKDGVDSPHCVSSGRVLQRAFFEDHDFGAVHINFSIALAEEHGFYNTHVAAVAQFGIQDLIAAGVDVEFCIESAIIGVCLRITFFVRHIAVCGRGKSVNEFRKL